MVSQSFAAKYFRGRDAVGHHLNLGGGPPYEIVGIAGDVQQHSGLGVVGPVSVEPTIYLPAAQLSNGIVGVHAWFPPKWVVRATGAVGTLEAQIQAAVATADPQLPIARFQTIDDLQAHITSGQRYNAALFSMLASLALLLAGIGLYGLISQSISQRTHELGIRLALGATAHQAMANAIKPGILLALAGVGAGYGLSLVAVRFLKHLLFGVRVTDTLTFAGTAGILLLVTVLASVVPALRILRLDPARTLRNE
jgi:predicted lysophospholipase L1 biosynthesis ABC-type transport system permease subunit